MTNELRTAIRDMRLAMEVVADLVKREFPVGSRWLYTDPTRRSRSGTVVVRHHGGTYLPDNLPCEWVDLPVDEWKWLDLTNRKTIVCEVALMKKAYQPAVGETC